jgi:hypothetical protein
MKKLFAVSIALFIMVAIWAQIPQKMSYQSVVRNSSNQLIVNQKVGMRISILQGSESGLAVYTETQDPITNSNGLITIEIGNGATVDVFSSINWAAGPYFIKTETDPAGGSNYTISGVSQLLSVPYAMYAGKAEIDLVDDADADPTNEIQSLSLSGTDLTLSRDGGTVNLSGLSGLTLPFNVSDSYATTPFSIENTGTGLFTIGGTSNAGCGIYGKTKAFNGAGVYGSGYGSDFSSGVYGNTGENNSPSVPGNAGVLGLSDNHIAVAGSSLSGTGGYFTSNTGLALNTSGRIKLTGIGEAAGRVLKSDANGEASWQDATGGGLTLPYSDTVAHTDYAFTVTNTESSAIKGISSSTGYSPLCGVEGVSHAINGIGVRGSSPYCGLSGEGEHYGVMALATGDNSIGISSRCTGSNGWAGAFVGNVLVSGRVGINNDQPNYTLDVYGNFNFSSNATSVQAMFCNGREALWYNDDYFSWGYGANWNYFGNRLFIGPAAADPGANTLVVNGAAAKPGGGSWATWSDSRLKDIHGDYEKGLNEIVSLEPVKFNYKKGNACNLPSDQDYVGFVAQDVQKIFPEAVSQGKDGYLSLDIHSINMAMVNAVKELKAENDKLKAENEKINSRLVKLEKLIGR